MGFHAKVFGDRGAGHTQRISIHQHSAFLVDRLRGASSRSVSSCDRVSHGGGRRLVPFCPAGGTQLRASPFEGRSAGLRRRKIFLRGGCPKQLRADEGAYCAPSTQAWRACATAVVYATWP